MWGIIAFFVVNTRLQLKKNYHPTLIQPGWKRLHLLDHILCINENFKMFVVVASWVVMCTGLIIDSYVLGCIFLLNKDCFPHSQTKSMSPVWEISSFVSRLKIAWTMLSGYPWSCFKEYIALMFSFSFSLTRIMQKLKTFYKRNRRSRIQRTSLTGDCYVKEKWCDNKYEQITDNSDSNLLYNLLCDIFG